MSSQHVSTCIEALRETIIPTSVRYWPFCVGRTRKKFNKLVIYLFLLALLEAVKKKSLREGTRMWISGTMNVWKVRPAAQNKGPINYKEILIFIVRVLYIYMYTRGHIMHREINNRVIIAALRLTLSCNSVFAYALRRKYDSTEWRNYGPPILIFPSLLSRYYLEMKKIFFSFFLFF